MIEVGLRIRFWGLGFDSIKFRFSIFFNFKIKDFD